MPREATDVRSRDGLGGSCRPNFVDLREILTVVLIFVPLQLARPNRPKQKIFRKQWLSDAGYLFFNGVFIQLGVGLLTVLMLPHLRALLPNAMGAFITRQPLWIQAPAAFVVADIGYYWMHRAFHAVPFLWRFHAVHHSIEDLDWLAAHRVHPVDQVLTTSASLLPVLMLGFSLPAMAIYGFVHLLQSHLVHANVRMSFGHAALGFCVAAFSSLASRERRRRVRQEFFGASHRARLARRHAEHAERDADQLRHSRSGAADVSATARLAVFSTRPDDASRRSAHRDRAGYCSRTIGSLTIRPLSRTPHFCRYFAQI